MQPILSAVDVESLQIGDVVRIDWLDASEAMCRFSTGNKTFDTPVRSYGVFLGVKGLRTRHVIVAKEVVERDRTFHYNAIPMGLIERVVLLKPKDLERQLLKHLRKKVELTPLKKFHIGLKGGRM